MVLTNIHSIRFCGEMQKKIVNYVNYFLYKGTFSSPSRPRHRSHCCRSVMVLSSFRHSKVIFTKDNPLGLRLTPNEPMEYSKTVPLLNLIKKPSNSRQNTQTLN